jgi:hypothetical protein
MRSTALTFLLAATGLAGCAVAPPAQPVETRRQVTTPPDVAEARVQMALDELGFAPAAPDGTRRRNSAPEDWASCEIATVRGGESGGQRDFARPQSRSAAVRTSVVPAGEGSLLSVAADFAAAYHHRYRNLPFAQPCRSLGVLEARLLDAAG